MTTPIEEYEAILERIFSVYLDATEGFRYIAESAGVFINPHTPEAKTRDERGVSPAGYVIYALGSPDNGDYMELSSRRGEEIISDNRDDGPNWDFIGRMSIVAAYQFWEDHYRTKIAEYLGIAENDLKVPIFGDLRLFRRSIIHNKSRWSDELRKIECFSWKENTAPEHSEEIHFPRSIIMSIWHQMRLALDRLKVETN